MTLKSTSSPRLILPVPPQSYNSNTFAQAFDAIRRAVQPLISKDEAAPRLLLRSPDGTVYEVTVSNAGVLSTTVNSGNSGV